MFNELKKNKNWVVIWCGNSHTIPYGGSASERSTK